MKTTIILAHPWHGSFNKAIMDSIVDELSKNNKEYQIIDLYKDGFNPLLEEQDLALFSKGQSTDPMVEKYQEMLKTSDEAVFIFPIWWYDVPAILKGFIDKVMLKNFAYQETSKGLKGLLGIQKTTVITTSEWPTFYLRWFGGNTIKGTFINKTLKLLGFKDIKWINSGFTSSSKNEKRVSFMEKVNNRFK